MNEVKEPSLIKREDLARTLGDRARGGLLVVDSVLANAKPVDAIADELGMIKFTRAGEPMEADIDELAQAIRDTDHRAVIAVGGGSILDATKAAASVAADCHNAAHYQLGAQPMPMAKSPLVCVPTTSGTGSEVTRVSVIGDNKGVKKWMYGDALWPHYIMLMPTLTHSVPPVIKMFCGLDAMVHALEAASGKNRNDQIIARAAKAIPVVLDLLADSVAGDPEADRRMQLASMHAGRAIDLGGTTIGHCIGHALGTVCKVNHGQAVALATQITLEQCVNETPQAFEAIEQAVGRGSTLDLWFGLVERLGTQAFGFAPASTVGAADVLASALSPENQPMRNGNELWFDDDMMAASITALMESYRQ